MNCSDTIAALADEAEALGSGLLSALLSVVAGLDIDTNPLTRADMAARLIRANAEPPRTPEEIKILDRAIASLHGLP